MFSNYREIREKEEGAEEGRQLIKSTRARAVAHSTDRKRCSCCGERERERERERESRLAETDARDADATAVVLIYTACGSIRQWSANAARWCRWCMSAAAPPREGFEGIRKSAEKKRLHG